MIIRIMGEGQYEVADHAQAAMNTHDDEIAVAVEAGDEESFRSALHAMLAELRSAGARLPDDSLISSDVVLPSEDATIEEVRDLLGAEGLLPG
ncbi:MAG TPA: hypothetical protein VIM19_17770 [Actinomycetes bacterium]